MAVQWYVKVKGKRAGPISAQQLKALVARGKIGPEDLVRQGDGRPWVPASRVKGLFPSESKEDSEATSPSTPASKGRKKKAAEAEVEPAGSDASAAKARRATKTAKRPRSSGRPAIGGFHVEGDSPTDRVLGRGASARTGWLSGPVVVGTAAVVMLIGVLVVGGVLMSGGESDAPSAAEPIAAAGEPTASAEQEAKPADEETPQIEDADSDPWKLDIEGLEELGIVATPSRKSDAANEAKKAAAPKKGDGGKSGQAKDS